MTNQEAIEYMKAYRHRLTQSISNGLDKDIEAFDMAINALEQERSRSAEITQYRHDCEKLMEENERIKKALEQESCEDAISRTDVLALCKEEVYKLSYERKEEGRTYRGYDEYRLINYSKLQRLPSVNPQEPKTGHWIESDIPNEKYVCSECGGACWYYDYQGNLWKSNYCPNCGCRMVEPQESEG